MGKYEDIKGTTAAGFEMNSVLLNPIPGITGHAPGRIFYDVARKTIAADIGNETTLQIGQEDIEEYQNVGDSNIKAGETVYIFGANGTIATCKKAKADAYTTSVVCGVATEDIDINASGFVTVRGQVHNLDTTGAAHTGGQTWANGEKLYLSSEVAGELSNLQITDQAKFDVVVGYVIYAHATEGVICVEIQPNRRLTDLSDVTIAASPVVDDALIWNGTQWVNKPAGSVSAGAPTVLWLNAALSSGGQATLSVNPDFADSTDSCSVNASTVATKHIEGYISSAALGGATIEGGEWTLNLYALVSSTSGSSTITAKFGLRHVEPGTVTVAAGTATLAGGGAFGYNFGAGDTGDSNASLLLSSSIEIVGYGTFPITSGGAFGATTCVIGAGVDETGATAAVPTVASGVVYFLHHYLFSITSADINSTTEALQTLTALKPAYTGVTATDKLTVKFYGTTTRTSATTITFHHSTAVYGSKIITPLVKRHNDLSGLNAGDYQHLTAAQVSALHPAVTVTSPLAKDAGQALTHVDTDGNRHVPANSTTNSGKVLTAAAEAGTYTWETPSSSGHTIQEEGTPLTARPALNFVGAGVTVTDSASPASTIVTISGAGGLFDVDINGDVEPITDMGASELFSVDENGDLTPDPVATTNRYLSFYIAAGTRDSIYLLSDDTIPFFLASGVASNIPV